MLPWSSSLLEYDTNPSSSNSYCRVSNSYLKCSENSLTIKPPGGGVEAAKGQWYALWLPSKIDGES